MAHTSISTRFKHLFRNIPSPGTLFSASAAKLRKERSKLGGCAGLA